MITTQIVQHEYRHRSIQEVNVQHFRGAFTKARSLGSWYPVTWVGLLVESLAKITGGSPVRPTPAETTLHLQLRTGIVATRVTELVLQRIVWDTMNAAARWPPA